MKVKVELTPDQWNYIFEVLGQHNSVEIKKIAIELLTNAIKEQELQSKK